MDSELATAEDLDQPSVHIAVNAGGHLERVTRRLFPAARIEAVSDNATVLRRLLTGAAGAADAIVTDTLEAPHWQRDADIELRPIGPLTRDLKAAWFPPKNEPEALRFDRWLLRAESTGQLDQLRQEFGLPRSRTARPLTALLSSLNERLTLMPAVAEAKHLLGAPIENPEREEIVLDSAVRAIEAAAQESKTPTPDPNAVRRLFRAQIEAAKWIQIQHLQNVPDPLPAALQTANPEERREAQIDAQVTLDEVIRPALIYLGNRISLLIIASSIAESPENLSYADVTRALEGHDLPETNLRALYDALSEITTREKRIEPARRPSPARTSRVPSE
jgi:chorismate mutase